MKEHKVNESNNFIAGWYFEDHVLCDEIIKYFDQKEPKHFDIDNPQLRNSVDVALEDNDLLLRYLTKLKIVLDNYKLKYDFCHSGVSFNWGIDEYPKVQYYEPPYGGYHIWHCERGRLANLNRHLVYMTYLNDVSVGGETEWYYQNLKIKPEKGLTVIWPTDWTFTHKGNTSPTEKKYVITGWYKSLL